MDLMTSDQYTALVGFLRGKFDAIDRRFEEAHRHATVLFEQAREERRRMMAGVDARFEKVDEHLEGIERRLGDRITSVEEALGSLDASVRRTLVDHERRLEALEGS
jgi:hypothetical protein